MKKYILLSFILTAVSFCSLSYLQPSVSKKAAAAAIETINPCSDYIVWCYKTENGKTYKRLYNVTKDKWIGEWILVE